MVIQLFNLYGLVLFCICEDKKAMNIFNSLLKYFDDISPPKEIADYLEIQIKLTLSFFYLGKDKEGGK